MKKMVLLAPFIFLPLVLAEDCIVPEKADWREDVLLCLEEYNFSMGVIIENPIRIDCNNSTLIGTPDRYAFLITSNATVTNCQFRSFGAALVFQGSKKALVYNNIFKDNIYGIYMNKSTENNITSNKFQDNSLAVLIEESSSNYIYGNEIYPIGIRDDNKNIYCYNGVSNSYYNTTGPECPKEEENAKALGVQEELKDIPTAERAIKAKNTTELSNTSRTPRIERSGEIVIQAPALQKTEQILRRAFILEGKSEQEARKSLEDYSKTQQRVILQKKLVIKDNRTIVFTRLRAKAFFKDLYIYEYIPKCFAKNSKDLLFKTKPTKIIESDPIIMWHFANVQPDEEIELVYETTREVYIMPETLVINDDEIAPSYKESNCPESNLPVSLPLGKCRRIDYTYLLPAVVALFITFSYLYFNKFKKHFKIR
ncbi:MAG: NosD domain-containing protein [Candidatus Woesearchaeota archaeon]